MNVLPPAGVRQPELHGRGGDAVGRAIAGELRQELVVLGGEARLLLLQRRDLVARLGGGGGLPDQQQSCGNQRRRADEWRDRWPATTPARARRGKRARRGGRVGAGGGRVLARRTREG